MAYCTAGLAGQGSLGWAGLGSLGRARWVGVGLGWDGSAELVRAATAPRKPERGVSPGWALVLPGPRIYAHSSAAVPLPAAPGSTLLAEQWRSARLAASFWLAVSGSGFLASRPAAAPSTSWPCAQGPPLRWRRPFQDIVLYPYRVILYLYGYSKLSLSRSRGGYVLILRQKTPHGSRRLPHGLPRAPWE